MPLVRAGTPESHSSKDDLKQPAPPLDTNHDKRIKAMDSTPHPLVQLARRAIEAFILDGKRLTPPTRSEWVPEMFERAGVFVSLHARGDLRGCIGTFQPVRETVAEEIIDNAISAATRDPRFFPVEPTELNLLEISVDVLSVPEAVDSLDELDADKYGIIVEHAGRRGLLLPSLPQVTTAEQQVAIAKQKAFIAPYESVRLYRFQVRRFH